MSDVYKTINDRLGQMTPPINLDHLIDFKHVAPDGKPTFRCEPTVLGGVFFHPKDFSKIWNAFRNAHNNRGERAFDYYALPRSKLEHFFKSVFALNMLDISYLATRGFGFREIWNPFELDSRPLFPAEERTTRSPKAWDKAFERSFGSAMSTEKRRDITALHVALMDDICNIHIDDVGFVLRGHDGVGGMSPDFGQHLVDELLWKTYLAPAIWQHLGEYVTIDLPSSRTNYAPTVGITVDWSRIGLSVSAAFTYNCKCLPGGRLQQDGTIPEGWSVGLGIKKTF